MPSRNPELERAIALSVAGRNPEAVLIINQLAGRGDADALAMLAEMKWRGGIIPQDLPAARELFGQAGNAGHGVSAAKHTNLLASGIAGPRDWPLALKRLERESHKSLTRKQVGDIIKMMKLDDNGDAVALPEGQRLSETPEVLHYPRLFSRAECDFLRRVAEPLYEPSSVYDSSGTLVRDLLRTSHGATLHWLIEDPAVHALNRRLAKISGTAPEQGEAIQILKYQRGEEYRPHLDFVRASENQRNLTALVYLNDEYVGGETWFVQTDLKIKGKRGDAILFRNTLPDRQPDKMSEHASLPVISGVKYLASRWIRESRWVP